MRDLEQQMSSGDALDEPTKQGLRKQMHQLFREQSQMQGKQQAFVLETMGRPESGTVSLLPKGKWSEGAQVVERLVDERHTAVLRRNPVAIRETPDRTFYQHSDGPGPSQIFWNPLSKQRGVAHELGHHLEYVLPDVQEAAVAFWHQRTRAEAGHDFDGAYQKKDRFPHHSMGKVYTDQGTVYGTEIVSAGLEWLATRPIDFALKDPEYFEFIQRCVR